MKLQALGTRVLVKMDSREQHYGSIFIPEAYLRREIIGTVESVGLFTEFVNTGDRVLIKQNAGVEVIVDGNEYTLVDEDDILCSITDSDTEFDESSEDTE